MIYMTLKRKVPAWPDPPKGFVHLITIRKDISRKGRAWTYTEVAWCVSEEDARAISDTKDFDPLILELELKKSRPSLDKALKLAGFRK